MLPHSMHGHRLQVKVHVRRRGFNPAPFMPEAVFGINLWLTGIIAGVGVPAPPQPCAANAEGAGVVATLGARCLPA